MGSYLLESGDEGGAEACFRSALVTAREQGARMLELRAAMSLARLQRRRGQAEDARQMLAGVYAAFTEGFSTADLQSAAALLESLELAQRAASDAAPLASVLTQPASDPKGEFVMSIEENKALVRASWKRCSASTTSRPLTSCLPPTSSTTAPLTRWAGEPVPVLQHDVRRVP